MNSGTGSTQEGLNREGGNTRMKILQPPEWLPPKGYVNGIAARGTLVVIAGQIGWNGACEFETDDFTGQFRQALSNVLAVAKEAGAGPEHLVRLTWYITDKAAYLAELKAVGSAYRELMGRWYPAMAVIEVKSLMEDRAKIEIEALAVVPDPE